MGKRKGRPLVWVSVGARKGDASRANNYTGDQAGGHLVSDGLEGPLGTGRKLRQ